MAGDMSDLQNSPSISSSAQQLQPSQPQNVQSLELPNHDSADAQYEIEWVMKSFKCAQKLRQDNFFKARSIRVDEFHKDEARRRQAYFAAEQIRLKQFQEAQTLKRKLFEDVEYNKELEETRYFTTICQTPGGITFLRKTTRPAYAFERFSELPVEIQTKIWSMATRTEEPKTHFFACDVYCYRARLHPLHCLMVDRSLMEDVRRLPSTLFACVSSRKVALTIYTLFYAVVDNCGSNGYSHFARGELFVNTLYDNFVLPGLGNLPLIDCPLLMDLLVKWNSPEAPPQHFGELMDKLSKIRKLSVSLDIFSKMPPNLWTEFKELERLTITFGIQRDDRCEIYYYSPPHCDWNLRPKKGSLYWSRAAWVYAYTHKLLDISAEESPNWKRPMIFPRIHPDRYLYESFFNTRFEPDVDLEWTETVDEPEEDLFACSVSRTAEEASKWFEDEGWRLSLTPIVTEADIKAWKSYL